MTTQTWLANTTAKSEAAAGTAVTLRAAQSGSSKKLTVNSGLISFLQNSSALTMSGYSLTGSQATSLLDMTGTWNTSGAPTALKLNVTDTNSNASSALLDLQVGGVSQFKVSKAGAVTAVGVAIPTISSSDTLTNKTLSSPVLSGTVSGTPTYSGSPTYNARLLVNARNSDFKDENFGGTSTGVWGAARFYADAAYSGIVIQADTSQSASLIRVINSTDTADLAAMSATGSWSVGGVAVPTISSTDTLSNKTLSSPTLSGTVAGSPALTGQWQWSGGNDAAYWHAIVLAPTDAGNNKPSLYITHTSPSAYAIGLYDGTDTDGTIAFNCGVLNHNGATITTTTNTQTLTNKTLSSPTLSGTVAGDNITFTGPAIKIGDGTDTVAMTGTSPLLRIQGASFGTGITVRRDGYAEVGMNSSGTGNIGTWTNHPVNLFVNAANRIEFNTSLMTFNDAYDIAVGTTTGTKIGTSTSQKLGFFNKTPVVQPTAVADATDAASVITQLNALLTRMRNLGLIAT